MLWPMASATRLPPGSQIPTSEPRRYKTRDGYTLLRWKIGTQQYVEALEHRVINGQITTSPHVHHVDGDKTNNDPSNLEPLTPSEHYSEHRQHDYEQVAAMYRAGTNIPEISQSLGINTGNVCRILIALGVDRRDHSKVTADMEADMERMMAAGCYPICWCRKWEVSRSTATIVQRKMGLRSKSGRIPASHLCD